MTKSKKRKIVAWHKKLDEQAVQEALEDATVDCYDEVEQYTGLVTMAQQELQFPFQAEVLGEILKVVDAEVPEDDAPGLDLIVERNGQRHRIEARSVQLVPPFPEGHLYLAAYLQWKASF